MVKIRILFLLTANFYKKILKLINNKNYDFMLLKVKNMLKFIKIKQG
ncbi:hypothetical protein CJE0531 [Campylobacter jejuni RM1221]|nr:hypothetical protein CJE0531 [Campylobacter jejuni RM1221]